jgi:hypothetical protein
VILTVEPDNRVCEAKILTIEERNSMKLNIGNTDRIIRVIIAALLAISAWIVGFGAIGGIVLLVLAAVMLITSAVGFCPVYAAFTFSTRRSPARS